MQATANFMLHLWTINHSIKQIAHVENFRISIQTSIKIYTLTWPEWMWTLSNYIITFFGIIAKSFSQPVMGMNSIYTALSLEMRSDEISKQIYNILTPSLFLFYLINVETYPNSSTVESLRSRIESIGSKLLLWTDTALIREFRVFSPIAGK